MTSGELLQAVPLLLADALQPMGSAHDEMSYCQESCGLKEHGSLMGTFGRCRGCRSESGSVFILDMALLSLILTVAHVRCRNPLKPASLLITIGSEAHDCYFWR